MEVDIIEKGFFQKLSKMNECDQGTDTSPQGRITVNAKHWQ